MRRYAVLVVLAVIATLLPDVSAGQVETVLHHSESLIVPGDEFVRPGSLAVGPDGLLYATFPIQGLIRVVDAARGIVRSTDLSRPDVRYFPVGLGWSGDDLWCTDAENTVLAFLDRRLRITSIRRLTVPARVGSLHSRQVAAVRPDGRMIVLTTVPTFAMVLADGGIPDDMLERVPTPLLAEPVTHIPVWILGMDGTVLDTLALLATRDRYGVIFSEEEDRNLSIIEQPFANNPHFGLDATGTHAVIADGTAQVARSGAGYTLFRIGARGDTISTVRLPVRPVRIEEEWVRAALAEIGRRASNDPSKAMALARGAVRIPATLPPISRLVVGRDGWVWIGRERVPGADRVLWDIVDPANVRIGTIALRSDLTVVAVDGTSGWALEGTGPHRSLWHITMRTEASTSATGRPLTEHTSCAKHIGRCTRLAQRGPPARRVGSRIGGRLPFPSDGNVL